MSVVDWVCKKISLESASEQLSAITISRQQVLPSKLDACANVTTCCLVKAVKNTSSLLQFSGLSELENGLFQLDQESDRQRWLGAGFSLF